MILWSIKFDELGFNSYPYIWIGMTNLNPESEYQWIDGSPMNYQNWHPNEPNGSNNYGSCIIYYKFNNQIKWSDITCTNNVKFVCKKKSFAIKL